MKTKFLKLWRHFKIQDDELLVIQVHHNRKQADEYLVLELRQDDLTATVIPSLAHLPPGKHYCLIQHRGKDGHFRLPSISKILSDRYIDY